jgi:hypothetical protein
MTFEERCAAMGKLGDWLLSPENQSELEMLYRRTFADNGWFSSDQSSYAIHQIASCFLKEKALLEWASADIKHYPQAVQQKVGLILAGNIPAVGFHDLLCCFISGHKALIKYSDKDKLLIPFLIKKLIELSPNSAEYLEPVDRLQQVDKVIATGSDNSSRYFEHYFANVPHIIRANRNSVAVLHGDETAEDLAALGEDIFRYYGLGCRSVSKIYVPLDFKLEYFMEQMDKFSPLQLSNSKYQNNFDYNRSVYLLNGTKHWCNDSLILMEDKSMLSRIATLHFEYYDSKEKLVEDMLELLPKIQCIVSKYRLQKYPVQEGDFLTTFKPGESQLPKLNDYADAVDTLLFLLQ